MEEKEVENSLAVKYPSICKEWHPTKNGNLTPYMISYSSGRRVWWLGKCGHEWDAEVYSRIAGGKCPYCSHHRHSAIYCKENGKTYYKYQEVADDLGISIASVSLVVNGKQNNVKGYHLEFIEE